MSDLSRVVLIPAYEPDQRLPALVRELTESGFSVILVNDGSAPGYDAVFTEAASRAVLLRHTQNRGKGAALKTGLAWIAEHSSPDAVVVTADADGQHTPEDIGRVCREAWRHPGALILGCRAFTGRVPWKSRFGNGLTRLIFRLNTGRAVSDTQTGLRAFHVSDIPAMLRDEGSRYEYEMNVLLRYAYGGLPIVEVPIQTIYEPGNPSSHFHPVRDSILVYRQLFRFAASSLISFLADYGLYSLFTLCTAGLGSAGTVISNIAARALSATLNYGLNRTLVFGSRERVRQTAPRYFLLALGILAGNTAVLWLLADVLGVNRYLAKLLTECCFFLLSWFIQRLVIFRPREA